MTTLLTAEALYEAGRHAAAAELCRDRLAQDIDDQPALGLYGLCLVALGRRAEGIAMLAGVDDPDARISTALSSALRDVGLGAEAMKARMRHTLLALLLGAACCGQAAAQSATQSAAPYPSRAKRRAIVVAVSLLHWWRQLPGQ